jgi:hypothetical protein
MGLIDIIRGLASSSSQPPTDFYIKPENTDNPSRLATPFKQYQHYFMVQINEMYLSEDRQWFRKIMPLVYTSTEFKYRGMDEPLETPFVVGPALLGAQIKDKARDMVFRDTTVAGWHPYRGGRVALTVLLCKTTTENLLLHALGVIEKVSGLFGTNVSAFLTGFVNVSKIVSDSLDGLLNSKDIEGLACLRREFESTSSSGFYPGYYLLFDKTLDEKEKDRFFVKGNRLYYGDSLNTSKPYRDNDYVLINIDQTESRGDYQNLPFYKIYDQAIEMAAKRPMDDDRKEAINNLLLGMTATMMQSPDLVEGQADAIGNEAADKIRELVNKKYKLGEAPAQGEEISEVWLRLNRKIKAI